jgi:Zn-dependent protease
MHRGGMRVLRVYGIDVYLHSSWWFIVILLAYSLSTAYFPEQIIGVNQRGYWTMGIIAALLLFVSVLFHELSHSLVARARNVKVDRITLFFFGGVASLPEEDLEPTTEFWMALAGPLFSLALAFVLYMVAQLALPVIVVPVVTYLWQLNLILALFNLVPGYPLDGGRVFRALLMFHYKDIRKATKIAARFGQTFAVFLMFLGFLAIVGGNFGGLWFVLIGAFIWFVAKSSYHHVIVKEVLKHVPLSKVMTTNFSVLKSTDKFEKAVQFYRDEDTSTFVVQDNTFLGVVNMGTIRRISRPLWSKMLVKDVMIPKARVKGITLKQNAYDALRVIDTFSLGSVPVVDDRKVKGVVHRRKLAHYLALELEYGKS